MVRVPFRTLFMYLTWPEFWGLWTQCNFQFTLSAFNRSCITWEIKVGLLSELKRIGIPYLKIVSSSHVLVNICAVSCSVGKLSNHSKNESINMLPSHVKLLPSVYQVSSASGKGWSHRSFLSPWTWLGISCKLQCQLLSEGRQYTWPLARHLSWHFYSSVSPALAARRILSIFWVCFSFSSAMTFLCLFSLDSGLLYILNYC